MNSGLLKLSSLTGSKEETKVDWYGQSFGHMGPEKRLRRRFEASFWITSSARIGGGSNPKTQR
jgi:hypothetical protein